MAIKGIPKNETVWVTQKTVTNNIYYITAKPQRDMYFIYKHVDYHAEKIGRWKNPTKIIEQYAK